MTTTPARWRHGDAGDRYEVKVGDVWTMGPHVLSCGDVERGDVLDLIKRYGPPAMLYSDPPWSAGQAKSYRTMAFGKEATRKINYLGSFVPRLLEIAALVEGEVWFEVNFWHVDDWIRVMTGEGYELLDHWTIRNHLVQRDGQPAPCDQLRFSRVGPRGTPPDLTGVLDDETPRLAVEAVTKPGDLVLDPCLGQGLTALAAASTGRRLLGNELNPRRLAVSIDRLHRATGLAATGYRSAK